MQFNWKIKEESDIGRQKGVNNISYKKHKQQLNRPEKTHCEGRRDMTGLQNHEQQKDDRITAWKN